MPQSSNGMAVSHARRAGAVVAAAGLMFVAACSEPPREMATNYVPGGGDAWESRTPEEMGMDAATLQRAVD
jgi:hypothetical protein